jgi:hypothetical protein
VLQEYDICIVDITPPCGPELREKQTEEATSTSGGADSDHHMREAAREVTCMCCRS